MAREDRGQSLVEAALTMLVLIGLIFSVIEGSMAIYSYHYLANAAHEAARYAIVRGGDWTDSSGNTIACADYTSSQCMASPTQIGNYVHSRDFPGVNITASEVSVNYFSGSAPPATVSTACPATSGATTYNVTGDIVQVTICYPFTFAIPGIGNYTYHLASTSQMVIAQ